MGQGEHEIRSVMGNDNDKMLLLLSFPCRAWASNALNHYHSEFLLNIWSGIEDYLRVKLLVSNVYFNLFIEACIGESGHASDFRFQERITNPSKLLIGPSSITSCKCLKDEFGDTVIG